MYSDRLLNKKGRIIGRTLISDLPNIFIENIKNLSISEISQPVIANDGIYIIMICKGVILEQH